MSDSLKFGTSGLRGLAKELVGPAAASYALAFVAHLRASGYVGETGEVLVGRDLRDSSPAIADSVMAAIGSAGLRPLDCGPLPTPALALHALERGAAAIMVTGSHIPADRNGLKFYTPAGEITKDDEAGIAESFEPLAAVPSSAIAAASCPEALEAYLARCRLLLRSGALAGRRIGVWQHSSVFRDGMADLLAGFGADVVPVGRENWFKAVDTEAVSAADAAQISGWVRGHGLDALVSTDGDADRPLLADERGAVVRGDVLGLLTARYLGIGAVATPVTSTSAVESCGFFAQVVRTRVGSPFVIAGMERARLASAQVLGFEANGGVLLGSSVKLNFNEIAALPTRDAMLPILSVLGLAGETGMTLSELVATLPPRFSLSDRLEDVPSERSARLLAQLGDGFFAEIGTIAEVSDIDGRRFSFETGDVIHFRASGNAPELRCYTESSTRERAGELLAWGLAAAERVVR